MMIKGMVFRYMSTRGFIPKKIQWHIHAGSWSLVNCWREAFMRPYIRCSWILIRAAVGLTDGLGLDCDRCIRVISRQHWPPFFTTLVNTTNKTFYIHEFDIFCSQWSPVYVQSIRWFPTIAFTIQCGNVESLFLNVDHVFRKIQDFFVITM